MKHVIITASDSKYGNFLINHWLRSLKDNVDLKNVDIAILDYGLTKEQLSKLKDVIVYKGVRDGHVNCIRFRDMFRFLKKKRYDQVLSTDSGDIIFQDDIKKIFEKNKSTFRAVCEDFNIPFQEVFSKNLFSEKDTEKIKNLLKGKKMINAGVIFGPYDKFKKFCRECDKLIIDKSKFGPDQVAVNYILYKTGFRVLDKKYNFVVITVKNKFSIRDGVFYSDNKEKIAIVHNTGRNSFIRPVKNFGYGKQYNKMKKTTFLISRGVIRIVNLLLRLRKKD